MYINKLDGMMFPKFFKINLFSLGLIRRVVEASWNVMAHGDAQEGKCGENRRMERVASTLHTTSEHGVSSIRVQLECDGTRWRTGG